MTPFTQRQPQIQTIDTKAADCSSLRQLSLAALLYYVLAMQDGGTLKSLLAA